MDFVNTTPVPARLSVVQGLQRARRAALFTAKATFSVADDGRVRLDADAPLPVLEQDAETPFGGLPADVVLKLDPTFEVMVLGQAHSPTGDPVAQVEVALEVGEVRRRLRVTGDRVWQGAGEAATIGPPAPFLSMPLTWDRAFGGSVEAEIDAGAVLDLGHPLNREGRGFDHFAQALSLKQALVCPEGYPRVPEVRPLPNIEDPDAPVDRWDDEPLPVCWAPAPQSSGIYVERVRRRYGETPPETPPAADPVAYERAHPDWIVQTPRARTAVRLSGMRPDGADLAFRLPPARVIADVQLGAWEGEVELHPRTLILLPEEGRFCLVFRGGRRFDYAADVPRAARLRLARGWVPAAPAPAHLEAT